MSERPNPVRIALFVLGAALPLAATGCSSSDSRPDPTRALPFVVRLLEVRLPDNPVEPDATTPAVFSNPRQLTRELAREFVRTALFTNVVTDGDTTTAPDLQLELAVENLDFGPGRPTVGGAIFSTLAWIFAGHFSWFIDNRTYPDSQVRMIVRILDAPAADEPASRGTAAPIFQDYLPLTGMELNFYERSGMGNWLLNIFVPPWLGTGDPKLAGRSLAQRSAEFLATNEPDRIRASFPASYFRQTGAFLAYDHLREHLVIVSRDALDHVNIQSEATERNLDEDSLGQLTSEGPAREELWRWLAERVAGVGIDPADRYYKIPLKADERTMIRVTAIMEGGRQPARWTVKRIAEAEEE